MKNIIGYPNIVLITCQVLVLLEIRLSEGLKCLSCRQSAYMKSCFKTTTTCGYNEQCYLEKVVDSQYTTTFNAGCRRKDACPRGPSLLNLIGRRELPVSDLKRGLWNWTVCSECCNTTNKALPCNADLCNQGCLSVKSDIVFLLDSSSSIGNNLFEHTLKTFAVDFISNPNMLVGPEYNQIGLVSFTGHKRKITSLNRYHDKTTMSQAVLNNFHFEAGSTETHEALRLVKNFIFTPLFGDRPDAENILVIITDGGSHFPPETLKEAKRLKDAGVRIYAIGVGDYNTLNHLSEINGVSSGIFATYGLYPYNPRAIQELLWKSICQNSTTRFGDSHWQHRTTKHSTSTRRVTTRLTSPTVRTSVPTTLSTTPIPTTQTRISVPTAKTTTSVSVTPTRISVPTAKTRTSVSVTPTRISVPTLPVRISIPTAPNRVTVQTRISVPTVPSRISVPTSQIRISVPTAKTQTPVVAVTQTFPISVPSQTNKPASPSPCLDHPFCIASGISICSGGYANWARGSCPNLCGFCKATTPSSPKPTTISSTRKPARLTTNTSQRTKTSLTTRKQTTITSIAPNKSQTSSFTGKQTKIRTTLSTTTQPRRTYTPQQTTISTQTSSKKMCRGNSNCSVYGPTICGHFVSFAKTYCSAYCGYCTPPLTTASPNSAKSNSPTTRTTTMTPTTTKAHTKSTKAILTTSTTKAATTSTAKAATTSTTKSATTSTTTKAPTTSTTTKAPTTSKTTKAPTSSTTTKAATTSTTTKAPTTSTTTKASTTSVTTKAPRPAATTKTSKAVMTTSPKPSTTAAATTKKLSTGLSFDWKTIHIPG